MWYLDYNVFCRYTVYIILISVFEGLALDIDLIVLDALRCSLFHSRKNLEACDCLVLTHVDDDVMREGNATVGAPEGALLQVEDLVGILVASRHILVVSIGNRPWLTRKPFPIGIKQIQLRYAAVFTIPMTVERLYTEVSSAHGFVESYLLPSVSTFQRS